MAKRPNNKVNSNKQGGNANGKRGRNNGANKSRTNNGTPMHSNWKGKEAEINIPDSALNKADLKILTKDNHANNDENWYNKLGQIYTDATNIPFNVLAGLPFDPMIAMANERPAEWAYTAPSLMTIRLAPSVGVSHDSTSPINMAAQELYVAITKNNNRDGQYDKTDVIMLVVAMDSLYMLYEYLNRGYRAFGNISAYNRFYPLYLLQAMNLNVSELQIALEDYRSSINYLSYRLAAVNVPDVFSLISRHSWLFSHVYKDADTEKAQAYMYVPDGFYMWKEGTNSTPNSLQYIKFEDLFEIGGDYAAELIGLKQIQKAIDKLLAPILGSSYVGLISADIAKAYAESGMVKISPTTENEALEPQFDELVLMQMSNAKVVKGLTNMDITQNLTDLVRGPFLVHEPQAYEGDANLALRQTKHYFNFRGEVSNKDVGEASRLIAVVSLEQNPGSDVTFNVITCGTEIVTEITTYRLNYSSLTSTATLAGSSLEQTVLLDPSVDAETFQNGVRNFTQQVITASAFDWAPTQYIYTRYKTGTSTWKYVFDGVIQDLDNYTYLSEDQVKGLNDAIVMSEFTVSP